MNKNATILKMMPKIKFTLNPFFSNCTRNNILAMGSEQVKLLFW